MALCQSTAVVLVAGVIKMQESNELATLWSSSEDSSIGKTSLSIRARFPKSLPSYISN